LKSSSEWGSAPNQEERETVKDNKMMVLAMAAAMAIAVGHAAAYAQGHPSAKATAKVGFINVMDELSVGTNSSSTTTGTWATVLSNTLKTPNQKDVFIDVSLEVGLLTDTLVRSKNNTADTSMASAGVDVRVLIDGHEALPGVVVFGKRTQTLTARFQGIIDGCLALDTNTMSIVIDPDCVQPEELQLILETMNANSFNFIQADLPPGVHLIQVQARLNLGASAQAGAAKARALIGNGSVTVESVRMIRNEDIELD
jgi:hypothetical protein